MRMFAVLLATLVVAPAFAASEARIRFTHYDLHLGAPNVDRVGDVRFPGEITVSGKLHVELEASGEPELCGGACAYFVPDKASQVRLPRLIHDTGPTDIDSIALYDARPLLDMLSGRKEARNLLARNRVFEVSTTLTLHELHIYGACDAVHFEAKARKLVRQGSYTALHEGPTLGGC